MDLNRWESFFCTVIILLWKSIKPNDLQIHLTTYILYYHPSLSHTLPLVTNISIWTKNSQGQDSDKLSQLKKYF